MKFNCVDSMYSVAYSKTPIFTFITLTRCLSMSRCHARLLLGLLLLCTCSTEAFSADEDGFRPLFDGKTLEGWTQKGGKATYEVVDGAVVGTSVAQTPNSFLCTDKEYGDFVLEVELKVDNALNSGIQIRSHCFEKPTKFKKKEIPAGRVHGYQVEIDPTDRGFSGGIYDEGRRGWLNDLAGDKHKAARAAFKRDGWNKYRIEARGNSIKTWVNGIPAADLKDDVDKSGFIALQVHSVPNKNAGKQVRWRNIRIKELDASDAVTN